MKSDISAVSFDLIGSKLQTLHMMEPPLNEKSYFVPDQNEERTPLILNNISHGQIYINVAENN